MNMTVLLRKHQEVLCSGAGIVVRTILAYHHLVAASWSVGVTLQATHSSQGLPQAGSSKRLLQVQLPTMVPRR